MKINQFVAGMTVFDVHSYRMGNTTVRSVGIWPVYIRSIEVDKEIVIASWNGNPEKKFYRSQWSKWRKDKPTLVKQGFHYRLAKKGEQS